jgi:ATP-dependent exoDNAse (exonuclease V) beta subunit
MEVGVWSKMLSEKNIPIFSKLESNILQSDIIGILFSYFKILEKPYDAESEFLNILRSSLSGISMLDILRISNYLHRENYVRRGNKLKIFDILKDSAALDVI